jgi:acyl-CoA synthetase (NDP forming)
VSAIERLLRPRSVAVIGASTDPTKTAGRPVSYLVKHGFKGGIYPVNPRASEICGLQCYRDVAALPEAPDVGIVLVGPDRANEAVAALANRGTAAAIVLAGGYGETGEEGARRQRELKEVAGSMRILGPNTIGLVNITDRIMLSATAALEIGDLPAGRISVVSQSGGILGSLLSRAADRGIGFARLVSTGNEADIDVSEFVDVLIDDPETDVIALYLEGIRRPDRFRRAADRAAILGKPIVAFKVGRSETGSRAAVSHTGALAGADRIYQAMFRQHGVIRAETFSDLIDIPGALVCKRRPKGNRVAVLTSTGGASTLIADGCGLLGLALPDPEPETKSKLASLLDGEQAAASRNPVDVTLAGVKPDIFRAAIDALLASPSYDALVVVVGTSALANPSLAADAMLECQSRSEKPILAYVSPHAPHVVALLNAKGIPAFAAPESCSAALAAMWQSATRRPRPDPGSAASLPDGLDALRSGQLDEAEAKAMFAQFGIPGVRERTVSNARDVESAAREIGGRTVLKALSRQIAHKSDVGGVRLGIVPSDAKTAVEDMLAALARHGAPAPDGFLVQEMIADGVEMILGFTRDPQLGPTVLVGMGGVTAELVGDTSIRLLPIGRADAEEMIGELKTARLLTGYRGATKSDVAALADAIVSFARMAEALGSRLVEAEVNPLFVLAEGKGVRAADGLAVLVAPGDSPAGSRPPGA